MVGLCRWRSSCDAQRDRLLVFIVELVGQADALIRGCGARSSSGQRRKPSCSKGGKRRRSLARMT